jgi:hypothetical protein
MIISRCSFPNCFAGIEKWFRRIARFNPQRSRTAGAPRSGRNNPPDAGLVIRATLAALVRGPARHRLTLQQRNGGAVLRQVDWTDRHMTAPKIRTHQRPS